MRDRINEEFVYQSSLELGNDTYQLVRWGLEFTIFGYCDNNVFENGWRCRKLGTQTTQGCQGDLAGVTLGVIILCCVHVLFPQATNIVY